MLVSTPTFFIPFSVDRNFDLLRSSEREREREGGGRMERKDRVNRDFDAFNNTNPPSYLNFLPPNFLSPSFAPTVFYAA